MKENVDGPKNFVFYAKAFHKDTRQGLPEGLKVRPLVMRLYILGSRQNVYEKII